MGRIIPLTARTHSGQEFAKPRVIYVNEDNIRVVPAERNSAKGTKIIERLGGHEDTYEVYEKAMQVEVARNPSSTDVIIKQHCALGASAAGTNQGAATLIAKYLTEVTTVTSASAEGVRLPAATPGNVHVIINNDASNDALKVYPATSEYVGSGAQNAAYSLAGGKRASFVCVTAGKWEVAEDFGG